MFTGLVADIGEITHIERLDEDFAMTIRTGFDLETIELGESIAVDGVCLTVAERLVADAAFRVELGVETLQRTTLGDREVGDGVHLERALRADERMGGHFVLGHVDGVGQLVERRVEENTIFMTFEAPPQVARYLIEKGSVTIDGVSLTVNEVDGRRFGVGIIPHTVEKTNFGDYRAGREVNFEADVLGKYVEKFLGEDRERIERYAEAFDTTSSRE